MSHSLSQKYSTSKSEDGALVSPKVGNTMKQPLDRHGSGLTTFDNRFDDIGRKVGKSQKPSDIGTILIVLVVLLLMGRI